MITCCMDTRSDKALIDACNHGDAREATRAFETLYRRHKDYIVRVALRFVPDNDAALDVLQETFSYLLSKFPPSGPGLDLTAKLTTLLYPVAKNTALTLSRKSARFPAADTAPDELHSPAVAETDLDGLLRDLSAEHREVVLLRFVDDLALKDIANVLGIPLGTVKSRLHLAIRQLRELSDVKKMRSP